MQKISRASSFTSKTQQVSNIKSANHFKTSTVVTEEADLTAFYIISIIVGIAIMTITFFVCKYLEKERIANKIATSERKKPELWGVKKNFSSTRMSQDTIEDRNFDDTSYTSRSFRGGDIGGSSSTNVFGSQQLSERGSKLDLP